MVDDSYSKLLLHCDGDDGSTTIIDEAGHTVTAVNQAQIDTAQKVFGTGAILFDGTGDYVTTPNSADWNLGAANSGDFTIDGRIRLNSYGGGYPCLVSTADIAVQLKGYQFYYQHSGTKLYVWSGAGTTRGLTWAPSLNTWYHIALVRSGSTITMYVDGTSIGTVADGDFNNDGNVLAVGSSFNDNGDYVVNGWIDELRISKGIARWTANFTPPTSAYAPLIISHNLLSLGIGK